MFYGYQTKSDALKHWPETLLDKSPNKIKRASVCTRKPNIDCWGSIDGKEYLYSDGSRDFGVIQEITTITIGFDTIQFGNFR